MECEIHRVLSAQHVWLSFYLRKITGAGYGSMYAQCTFRTFAFCICICCFLLLSLGWVVHKDFASHIVRIISTIWYIVRAKHVQHLCGHCHCNEIFVIITICTLTSFFCRFRRCCPIIPSFTVCSFPFSARDSSNRMQRQFYKSKVEWRGTSLI